MSSKLSSYKGELAKKHLLSRFDLPPGIENVPLDWGLVKSHAEYHLTQARATFKKFLKASMPKGDPKYHTNVFTLSQHFVKDTETVLTIELCTRIALMRQQYKLFPGDNFWDKLDQRLAWIRKTAGYDENKISEAFKLALADDCTDHGIASDYTLLEDTVIDAWQASRPSNPDLECHRPVKAAQENSPYHTSEASQSTANRQWVITMKGVRRSARQLKWKHNGAIPIQNWPQYLFKEDKNDPTDTMDANKASAASASPQVPALSSLLGTDLDSCGILPPVPVAMKAASALSTVTEKLERLAAHLRMPRMKTQTDTLYFGELQGVRSELVHLRSSRSPYGTVAACGAHHLCFLAGFQPNRELYFFKTFKQTFVASFDFWRHHEVQMMLPKVKTRCVRVGDPVYGAGASSSSLAKSSAKKAKLMDPASHSPSLDAIYSTGNNSVAISPSPIGNSPDVVAVNSPATSTPELSALCPRTKRKAAEFECIAGKKLRMTSASKDGHGLRVHPRVCTRGCFKFNSILMLHIALHPSSKLEYFRINKVSKTANSTVETKVCTQFNLHQERTAEKKPEL
ncbi:hypothetical protein B0H14DRAFT_2573066 [Mycena olivaceomarginata]|nr:hypothetical protein B0H14DRAFT_2573066 [Mycena olivaceomarginata]